MLLSAYRTAPLAVLIAAIAFSFLFSNTIFPAFAQDSEFKWSFSEGNDASNRGRMTARLGYGVPETDNAQADGVCDARGGPANLILGADIGKLEEGSDVKVRFSGGGFEHTVSGIVFGTKIEEGITGVSLDIGVQDAFWSALTSKDSLDYQVPGYSSSRLNLQGGHANIRQFIRACRDYAQSTGAAPATASKPANEKPDVQRKASDASAQNTLNEKEAFENAKELGTFEGWEAFLERFPDGFRADLARAYVKRLGSGKTAGAKTDEPAQSAAPVPPPPADISLAMTSLGACRGGQNCSVTVTMTNTGGQPYSGSLTIATSVAPGSAELQGTGTPPFSCEGAGGGAICSSGAASIAPGQSETIPLVFRLPRNAGGQVTTCASIAWGGVPSALGAREVQRKLNELGFNAGPADGQPGRKTVAAIRAFQKSAGIQETGKIDLPLLLALFAPGGAGDANPANDQACAGAAVSSAPPLPSAYQGPPQPVCPRGQIIKNNGRCGCPSSVPVWTGTSCIPRLTRNCSRGRVYSKKQKLCVCPSARPHWYNNRCHAQFDNCPGDSVRVGDKCLKENDPGFAARPRPSGPQVKGCPPNTTRIGNSCVAVNLAPLFSAFGNKPQGGQGGGSSNRPNPPQGGGQAATQQGEVCPPGQRPSGPSGPNASGECCPIGMTYIGGGKCRARTTGGGPPTQTPGAMRVIKSKPAPSPPPPPPKLQKGGGQNQPATTQKQTACPPGTVWVRDDICGQKRAKCPANTIRNADGTCSSKKITVNCVGGQKNANGCRCPAGQTAVSTSQRLNSDGSRVINYLCQGQQQKIIQQPVQQPQQNVACAGGGRVINGRCVCPASRPRFENGKCKKAKGSSKVLQQLQQQQNQPQQQQGGQQRTQPQTQQQQQLQQGLQQLNKILSDARLKRDIEHLVTRDDGMKFYSFRYHWDDTAYVGVMAQDLLADRKRAKAVSLHPGGYYMVDYNRLGLEMVTLEAWRAAGR